MAKTIFKNSSITGIVTCVPEKFINIEDEVDSLYGGNLQMVDAIKKSIGLQKRHIVDNLTTTSDLCEKAANKLLDEMQVDKSDIGAVIFVTQTPDYFQPASAAYLHGKLGLSQNCAVFDVNQGCSGYVYGVWLANMILETRSCKKVLLLAGDTISKIVNPNDSNVAPMFGDAGTATIVENSEIEKKSYFIFHSNGKKFDTIIQPQGAFRNPTEQIINNKNVFDTSAKRNLSNLFMDGTEVFVFAINVEPKAITEILAFSNLEKEDIDYVVFHQANKYIISNIARRLKFPLEKVPSETTGRYGNQSSASIPCTICDAINNEVESRNVKLVLSGFGVGLSWATCQLDLDKIYCPDVIFY
jgi:3-oxoacyl-[acyl-carrier-protein] synthase III